MIEPHNPHARLLAKLVRELLAAENFTHLADLTEALKCRCARLKIRWTNEDLSDAFRLVHSNRPLIQQPSLLMVSDPFRSHLDGSPLSRLEAARVLAELREAFEARR